MDLDRPMIDGGPAREAFEALAGWVASLHGQDGLGQTLGRLVRLFGAEAAVVTRHALAQDRRRIVAVAACQGRGPGRGLAGDMMAAHLATLRPGAVSVLSELRRETSFVEDQWLGENLVAAGVRDLALVVLRTKGGSADYVEFLFNETIRRRARALMVEMAPALTAAWGGRLPGTVEGLITRRRSRDGRPATGDILAPSNPAGLSRSEYRICALVREGLLARAIAEELRLQESTVRSHLRSIYAKTGASGHIDLLHRLTSRAPVDDWLIARSA